MTKQATGILLFLFFASGVAALVYEVLWLKELGRLFGVTAYATSTTLAVFFLGLAAGGLVWGRRSARSVRPLRTYGLLELAIAISAIFYFFILDLYRAIYGPAFGAFGNSPTLFLGLKLALAIGILFLPAFFMGGTLPMMGQFLIRRADELGRRASQLYAINTVGAATGAFLAGFFLPLALGFRKSYLVAIGLNVFIGLVAIALSRTLETRQTSPPLRFSSTAEAGLATSTLSPSLIRAVAVVSGFATLALEVLWVRMYSQVFQNSVYTFSAILVLFLLSLALGSVLANLLCRQPWSPPKVLFWLLSVSGIVVGSTPFVFNWLTSGLHVVGSGLGWTRYILSVFGSIAVVVLPAGIVIGSVFPYLMKLAERWTVSPGRTIGRLAAANTAAAILGSLAAGFVMLDVLGLWRSIALMAILYLLLAVHLPLGSIRGKRNSKALPAVIIILLLAAIGYSGLASVRVDPASGEELLQVWEGSHGTVAVIRREGGLKMKLNNSYTLGGSDSAILHRRQSWIPLSIHPDAKSVFYLGMGTGISAGAALDHPIDSIVVTELSPDVIEAARLHFGPYLGGLFEDPRAEVLQVDGRNVLFGLDEQFDVIIADLFLSWKAGVGDLYTHEHFEVVKKRLAPGGLFAQWLPLAQLTPTEFGIIARTFLEVFPQATVWRRGFSLETPALVLIGQERLGPLDNTAYLRSLDHLGQAGKFASSGWIDRIPHALYAGNLGQARSLFEAYPINSDDRPFVEYLAPISSRESVRGQVGSLTGYELAGFYRHLQQMVPPATDPYLAELQETELNSVLAGYQLYGYLNARRAGHQMEARIHLEEFQGLTGISSLRTQ